MCKTFAAIGSICMMVVSQAAAGQDGTYPAQWDWSRVLLCKGAAEEIGALDSQIHQALQIISEEYEALRHSVRRAQAEWKSNSKEDPGTDERRDEQLARLATESRDRLESRLSSVLLPHQVERLDSLALWIELNGDHGTAQTLVRSPARKILDLGESDIEKLRSTSEELQAEFESELLELREKYRNQLLQELDPSQRAQLEALLGKPSDTGSTPLRF